VINLILSPKRSENQDRLHCETWQEPCYICGRPVDMRKFHLGIHVHDGGGVAVTEEEAAKLDPSGDMGFFPVGETCVKKHKGLRAYAVEAQPLFDLDGKPLWK
jgi:hypothetical protein